MFRFLRFVACIAFAALTATSAYGDEGDFHSAVERAMAQHRIAMKVLETRSQAETAAEVHELRAAWQAIGERFAAERPAAFADDPDYPGLFMQVDMSFVGLLLVIDLGNRDAAREALLSIGQTLARLSERSAPAPR